MEPIKSQSFKKDSEGRAGSGSSSSGSRSSIMSGRDSFDAYDMINAPQFMDFDDLRRGLLDDSEEADQFFSNHREEDDYLVPIESLSPSIQLLDFNPISSTASLVEVGLEKIHKENNEKRLAHEDNCEEKESDDLAPLLDSKLELHEVGERENEENHLEDEANHGQEDDVPILVEDLISSIQPPTSNLISSVPTLSEVDKPLEDGKYECLKDGAVCLENRDADAGSLAKVENLVSSLQFLQFNSISSKGAPVGTEAKLDDGEDEDDEEECLKAGDISISTVHKDKIEDPEDCFFDFETHILDGSVSHDSPRTKQNMNARLSSSVSDLAKVVVSQEKANAYGYQAHVGITIPRTPEKSLLSTTRKARCASATRARSSSASKLSSRSAAPTPKLEAKKVISDRGRAESRDSCRQSRAPTKQNFSYVSLAEAVNKFQRGTPDRFHTSSKSIVPPRAASSGAGGRGAGSSPGKGRRMPSASPDRGSSRGSKKCFETSTSSMDFLPSNAPNSNIKAGKSLGGAIKPAVFELPKRFDIKTTVPKPFKFHETRKRANVETEKEEFVFKARPAPLKIFHAPTGVKEKADVKTTCPVEVHFASDDRLKERHQRRAASAHTSPVRPIIARPSSASKIPTPSKRKLSASHCEPPKTTTLQPFSFEDRNKEAFRKRQERLQKELEEEKKAFNKEFHATPLPNFAVTGLPKKKPISLTDVAPFNFKVDERGAAKQQQFKQKLDSELKDLKEKTVFHANPPTVIYQKPFEPDYSGKILVEPVELNLNTDKRAQERERYELAMKQKKREEAEQQRQLEILHLEKEKENCIELRRQLVHKALPIKSTRTFEVKSSSKPLTEPKSPAFKPLPSQRRVHK